MIQKIKQMENSLLYKSNEIVRERINWNFLGKARAFFFALWFHEFFLIVSKILRIRYEPETEFLSKSARILLRTLVSQVFSIIFSKSCVRIHCEQETEVYTYLGSVSASGKVI